MSNINITSNFDDIKKAFLRAPSIMEEFLEGAFIESGEILNQTSKSEHPSWEDRFYQLRADIDYKYVMKKKTLEHGLGFNPKTFIKRKGIGGFFKGLFSKGTSYGVFLHEGTKYIDGDQWIYKSFDKNLDKIEKEFNEAISKGIDKIL